MKLILILLPILLLASTVSFAERPELVGEQQSEDQRLSSVSTPAPSLVRQLKSNLAYVLGLGSSVLPKTEELLGQYSESRENLRRRLNNLQEVVKKEVMRRASQFFQKTSEISNMFQDIASQVNNALNEGQTSTPDKAE